MMAIVLRKYVVTFLVGVMICFGLLAFLGIFDNPGPMRMYRILCDAFFATAVLLMGFGLLTVISAAGGFHIIGFSTQYVFALVFPGLRKGKQHRDFHEYRQSKKGVQRGLWHIVFVGAVFLAIAFVFLMLEAQVSAT